MHFVVCVDGTDQSDRALEHAADLAAATDGELTVVHAVDPQVYEQRGGGPIADAGDADQQFVIEAVEDAEARGEEFLAAAERRVEAVPVETAMLYGDADDAILEYLAEHDADGVVVGHRALEDRYQRLLGSVARSLVEHAPVPVTVVKE